MASSSNTVCAGAGSTKASSSVSSTSSRKHSEKSSVKLLRKKAELSAEGALPTILSPINNFLYNSLPKDVVTVQDASLDALCMLRIVHALNRHWDTLYNDNLMHEDIIPPSEFIHSKVRNCLNNYNNFPWQVWALTVVSVTMLPHLHLILRSNLI